MNAAVEALSAGALALLGAGLTALKVLVVGVVVVVAGLNRSGGAHH